MQERDEKKKERDGKKEKEIFERNQRARASREASTGTTPPPSYMRVTEATERSNKKHLESIRVRLHTS